MNKLLTKLDCARIANVSKRTIENWIKNGTLSYVKIGSIVRIPEDELSKSVNLHLVKAWTPRTKGFANGQ